MALVHSSLYGRAVKVTRSTWHNLNALDTHAVLARNGVKYWAWIFWYAEPSQSTSVSLTTSAHGLGVVRSRFGSCLAHTRSSCAPKTARRTFNQSI